MNAREHHFGSATVINQVELKTGMEIVVGNVAVAEQTAGGIMLRLYANGMDYVTGQTEGNISGLSYYEAVSAAYNWVLS